MIDYINQPEVLNMIWIIGMALSVVVAICAVMFTDTSFEGFIMILLMGVFTHYVIAAVVMALMGGAMAGACFLAYGFLLFVGDKIKPQGVEV